MTKNWCRRRMRSGHWSPIWDISLGCGFMLLLYASCVNVFANGEPPELDVVVTPELENEFPLDCYAFRYANATVKLRENRHLCVWYEEEGIRFDPRCARGLTRAFEKLAAPYNLPWLCQRFESHEDLGLLVGPSVYNLDLSCLYALHRLSPETALHMAQRILFSVPLKDGCASKYEWKCVAPMSLSLVRWPTVHRASFYLLLRHHREAAACFLELVKQCCPCVLVNADIMLLERASPCEREYFLRHGDWPHPDVIPGSLFLSEVRRESALVRDADASLFPDVPVFWFLKTWRDDRRSRLLAGLIEKGVCVGDHDYRTWPEYAYVLLLRERNIGEFRRLSRSGAEVARILGIAGLIQWIAGEANPDFREVQETRGLDSVYEGAPVWEQVWGVLRDHWAPADRVVFLERHGDKWLSLAVGATVPMDCRIEMVCDYVIGGMLSNPLGSNDTAAKLLIPMYGGRQRGSWHLIEDIAATRSRIASEWIKSEFNGFNESEKLQAITAARYFGREFARELSQRMTAWTRDQEEAWGDATLRIEKTEKAAAILMGYREKRISLEEAALDIATLRHDVVLPWLWALVRTRQLQLAAQTRDAIKRYIEESVTENWRMEYWIKVRMALDGLTDERATSWR